MGKLYRVGGLAAALLVSCACYAGDIEVSRAWTRATAPGQEEAAVDLTISSKQAATLVGISSPAARTVELHSMTMDGGMMRMREVKSIELPAGKSVNLEEGGYHVMLDGLKAPLKEGETLPLTLSIRVGEHGVVKLETKADVRSLRATNAAAPEEGHHHDH